MPVTRSKKNVPLTFRTPLGAENTTLGAENTTLGAENTTSSAENTTSSAENAASSAENTTSSAENTTSTETSTSRTTITATTTDATASTAKQNRNDEAPATPVRVSRTTSSTGSRKRRKELAKAREELLKKEVELAAARVALLEEESEEDESIESVTVRDERTEDWVRNASTLALTMEPHNVPEVVTDTMEGSHPLPSAHGRTEASPPRPSDGAHRQRIGSMCEAVLTNQEQRARKEHAYEATERAKEIERSIHNTPVERERRTYRPAGSVSEREKYLYDREPAYCLTLDPEPRNDVEDYRNARRDRIREHGPSTMPLPALYQGDRPSSGNNHDYKELAAALTQAARAMQPAVAPRIQELPIFNGAASDWLPFKVAFEESASQLNEQENLSRLRKSLKGAAKDAIQCLFVGHTSTTEVMELLSARFGRPDALVIAEMNKLRSLPKLSENPKDICIFASKVQNVTATVRALKKHHYLYNAEVVHGVVEKLPPALRYRYYDFKADEPRHQPDLITLSRFLHRTADRCGSFAPAELINNNDRREPNTKKSARNYHTQDQRATTNHVTSCPVCKKEGHSAPDCYTIKKAEVPARWELAKTHKLCFRCLRYRKFRHICKPKKCNIDDCEYMHHPLLHATKCAPSDSVAYTAATNDTTAFATVASAREKRNITAFLKIVPVQVTGPKGAYNTYALLDDGSTCTLIESEIAAKIGATGPEEPFFIEGVAGARIDCNRSARVRFNIRGRNSDTFDISGRTMKNLNLSPQSVPPHAVRDCHHLQDIEDQLLYDDGVPTVLLGQDNWHLLLTHEVRHGDKNEPVASLTNLGWVLHGARETKGRTQRVNRLIIAEETEQSMEAMMKQHFALEALGVEPKRSYNDDEQRALHTLEERTVRLPAGGFETGLLWRKSNPIPPSSYDMALKRLELVEKKLDRDENMKKRYKTQLQTLLDNDYAEIAPTSKTARVWYLPHFAVINPQKPEKLRIVHDAAARAKGTSLNDMLLSGPDLLQSLPGVLMRFRQRPVAVTADIKDMFMRVNIREEDRDMQRFLWRDDRRDGPPTEYRMKSVIFGATSSPCTAIYVKNKNAENFQEHYPEAASAIWKNHYVDDYLSSFNTEKEAIRVSSQVAFIHSRGNFFLQRWASNSKQVRATLAPGQKEDVVQLDPEKILGMVWNTEPDTLTFNVNRAKIPTAILEGDRTPTKREALRTVMSIYDPLGIATPVTIQAKRIMQDTWRSGIDWDAELEPTEAETWKKWMEQVKLLAQLQVPRCHPQLAVARSVQLHTFVDASSSAYAASVYWRVTDEENTVHVSLIAGKGRVAPLKTVSIPRLELQAAVLGCRLAQTAIEEHDIQPSERFYWSDSRTVLAWLRTGPRAYKPFVAHRVAEIAETTKTKEWRWVPSKENVADDATRDTPQNFSCKHRWYRGPEFLYLQEENWPREQENSTMPEETEEERVHTTRNTTSLSAALPDPSRFSSWIRLMRTTARVLQFIDLLRLHHRCAVTRKRTKKTEGEDTTWKNTKDTHTSKPPATPRRIQTPKFISVEAEYLHRATDIWIRAQQQEVFSEEVIAFKKEKPLPTNSRLSHLSIVCDRDGTIRLRSRVAVTTDIDQEQREPAVIDGAHAWTKLYIAWVHRRLHHGGFETTANEVRQQYWILRLRYAVRSELKRCQFCRIERAKPAQPSTGNHPRSRVAHHRRPFTFTGLDYFGPLTVTVGRTHQKRYGVLFTCLTTRAIHLELAGSLTTDSAVMALRRFINRRGCPTELWSDQGTNLKGADQEMKKAAEEATKAINEETSIHAIKWRYIPPSAPFMGGAWERMVRSVKTALHVTLRERAPKEEVLATLLIEAENTVNSRPLTHVSTDERDSEALTPNHFLLGGPSRVPLPGSFTDGDTDGKKQWKASQRLADMFWARWIREYLPELQHRREPRAHGAIKLNDLVMIADGTLPRNSWPRGVIVAIYPGPDGEVRAVDVRTTKGILRRPTKKLVILPVTPEPE